MLAHSPRTLEVFPFIIGPDTTSACHLRTPDPPLPVTSGPGQASVAPGGPSPPGRRPSSWLGSQSRCKTVLILGRALSTFCVLWEVLHTCFISPSGETLGPAAPARRPFTRLSSGQTWQWPQPLPAVGEESGPGASLPHSTGLGAHHATQLWLLGWCVCVGLCLACVWQG